MFVLLISTLNYMVTSLSLFKSTVWSYHQCYEMPFQAPCLSTALSTRVVIHGQYRTFSTTITKSMKQKDSE